MEMCLSPCIARMCYLRSFKTSCDIIFIVVTGGRKHYSIGQEKKCRALTGKQIFCLAMPTFAKPHPLLVGVNYKPVDDQL